LAKDGKKPVHVRHGHTTRQIGRAKHWADARDLAVKECGGSFRVASQWWLRGRRRVEVYLCTQEQN
jgi:hypothetical protein